MTKPTISIVNNPVAITEDGYNDWEYHFKNTLTATAVNATSLQWQKSTDGTTWVDISGATATILAIISYDATYAADGSTATTEYKALTLNAYYRCIASNADGITLSNVLHCVKNAGESDVAAYAAESVDLGTITVKHTLTATASNYASLKWQESADCLTWTDISGATATTVNIVSVTGSEKDITGDEILSTAYAQVPAYDKYIRCLAANTSGNTISNILHVVHAGGSGYPTVTTV
ncbi:MAG: hypothetical protein PHV39_02620 [Methanomicrobium sp.]|nr:hypothetical protein [Methanomicrobium sp.]